MLLREFFIISNHKIKIKLSEGGNSRAIDISSGDSENPRMWRNRPAFAEKIDLSKFPRSVVIAAFMDLFVQLNNLFKKYSAGKTYGFPGSGETGQYPKEGEFLWPDFDAVTNGSVFNGSAKSFFNKVISDEKFVSKKPKVGDIDIMIPEKHMHTLWYMLQGMEGKPITDKITYIGQNKLGPQGVQINAVFDMTVSEYGNVFPQIDFEASEFEFRQDEKTKKQVYYPTEWAQFSHSSHWADIEQGIKGVFHKYILRALASSTSLISNAVLLTPASGTGSQEEIKNAQAIIDSIRASLAELENTTVDIGDKVKKKELQRQIKATKADLIEKEKQLKRNTPTVSQSKKFANDLAMRAFSVLYGIRDKLEMQKDVNGRPLMIPDIEDPTKLKTAYKEVPPKQSRYENNLENMFIKLFKRKATSNDMEYFQSYVGILKLLQPLEKIPQNSKLILDLRNRMLEYMFGIKNLNDVDTIKSPEEFREKYALGQPLERTDWQTDLDVKVGALKKMWEMLPSTRFPKDKLDKILFLYYGENGSAYSSKDVDTIRDAE